VVLAVGTYLFWQIAASATQSNYSALWARVDAATHKDRLEGATELREIVRENAATLPGRTARFAIARELFKQGQEHLTASERKGAAEPIKSARLLYEELAGQCADSPLLLQEALMGIAKADEALVGITTPDDPKKDLEKALASYRRLADQYPNSVLGKAAAERVQELESNLDQVAKFYEGLKQAAGPSTPPPSPVPPEPEAKGP
jgi:hypothetical protein